MTAAAKIIYSLVFVVAHRSMAQAHGHERGMERERERERSEGGRELVSEWVLSRDSYAVPLSRGSEWVSEWVVPRDSYAVPLSRGSEWASEWVSGAAPRPEFQELTCQSIDGTGPRPKSVWLAAKGLNHIELAPDTIARTYTYTQSGSSIPKAVLDSRESTRSFTLP